jgi:hypothetical protein
MFIYTATPTERLSTAKWNFTFTDRSLPRGRMQEILAWCTEQFDVPSHVGRGRWDYLWDGRLFFREPEDAIHFRLRWC